MNSKTLLRSLKTVVLLASIFIGLWELNAKAATIALTQATPGYSYDIFAAGGTADPNAVLSGSMQPMPDASYYDNNTAGALTYTFNVAAGGDKLNINETNLYAFGGAGSLMAQYTVNGGPAVTLYNDVTATLTTGNGVNSGSVDVLHHFDNIALNPATANTIVLTYTANSPGGLGYEEQLFRHDGGGNGGPFIATATFTPEPSSLILCGLGAAGLFVAARRRRA